MNSNINIKQLVLFIFFVSINSSIAQDKLIEKNSLEKSRVVGEGTVSYITPSNTQEIFNYCGYVLKNPNWIIAPKRERLFTFLEPDSLIKIYKNKNVHIEGLRVKIPGKKINDYTYINAYDVIIIDKIYCLDSKSD